MLRYLRVAISVVSLLAFIALTVLWIRSYWRADAVSGMCGRRFVYLGTHAGQCVVESSVPIMNAPDRWRAFTQPVTRSAPPFTAGDGSIKFLGFQILRFANGWNFGVSFLWLLLATGLVSATLWFKARFRFGTSALLVAMTTLAFVLGLGGLLFRYLMR
jgi:hypothetical protein